MGTFKSEPSVLRIETELPTKSLILGFRLSSSESLINEHIRNKVGSKHPVGQYHTTKCVSCIVARIFSSVFH